MDTETKLTRRHEVRPGGTEHFAVIGELGAMHFHVHVSPSSGVFRDGGFYGGVEMHSRKPMYGDKDPDNENCWLLGCPCWHDGSSLQAEEEYIPLWKHCKDTGDFEGIWRRLERHYRERLEGE